MNIEQFRQEYMCTWPDDGEELPPHRRSNPLNPSQKEQLLRQAKQWLREMNKNAEVKERKPTDKLDNIGGF